MQLLGSPDDSDLGFLRSENARKYVKQLPQVPKQSCSQKFPDASPLAIDLAEKMLVFDPSKRITGIPHGHLNHPFHCPVLRDNPLHPHFTDKSFPF